MKTTNLLFLGATVMAVACGTPVEDDAIQPSVNGGKADGMGVTVQDGLDFGEDVHGEFASDLQFDAYEFAVREDAEISIDVTRRGSSSRVDTTMFLFGPKKDGAYPDDAIVFDDDDGWGKLSRITDFTLYREGTYMVVLGTKDGRGRGHYNLNLNCESDNCKPVNGRPIDVCDSMVLDLASECMNWVMTESDFDPGDEPSNASLIEDCLTRPGSYAAEDWFLGEGPMAGICDDEGICDDQTDPGMVYHAYVCSNYSRDWCDEGQAAFAERMLPACREALTIPPLPDLNLTEIEFSDRVIDPLMQKVEELCGEYCYLNVRAFSYAADEVPDLKPLTLMMAFEYGSEFFAGTTYYDSTQPALLGEANNLDVEGEFIAAVESIGFDLSQDHPVGRAAWSGVPYPSVDVASDGYTLVDADNKRLLFVNFSSASE